MPVLMADPLLKTAEPLLKTEPEALDIGWVPELTGNGGTLLVALDEPVLNAVPVDARPEN